MRGFTLLEVMIAVAILAVSLLAIFNLQSTSLLGSARAQKISVASLLARQKMAEVLMGIEKGIPKGEFPEEKEESGTFDQEKHPDYSWKVTIKKTELPAPPVPEGGSDVMGQVFTLMSKEISEASREVRLVISWKEFDEEEEGITLTTHVVKMQ